MTSVDVERSYPPSSNTFYLIEAIVALINWQYPIPIVIEYNKFNDDEIDTENDSWVIIF